MRIEEATNETVERSRNYVRLQTRELRIYTDMGSLTLTRSEGEERREHLNQRYWICVWAGKIALLENEYLFWLLKRRSQSYPMSSPAVKWI